MKRIYFIYLCGALIFVGFLAIELTGQHEEIIQKELRLLKEKYDFESWEPETGKVISGVTISEKVFPQLNQIRKLWEKDNYSIVEKQKLLYTKISQWWRLEENEFKALMVVGPTLNSVKDFLILTYLETQRRTPLIKRPGKDIGLQIGHICFVTADKEGEALSSVDFIRHNVLFMLRGEGIVRKDLRAIAEKLDNLLMQKKPVTTYEQLPDIPTIKIFSAEKTSIMLGEMAILTLEVDNPQKRGLRFFWDITGGGVKENLEGNFVYYGGEKGVQKITVTAINDLGLYDSESIEIEAK